MSLVNDKDLADLQSLEESLWRGETRYDDAYMERIFAPDFFEFGRSGKCYKRDEMFFGHKAGQEIDVELPLSEFHARYLDENTMQVTYVSKLSVNGKMQYANRSSIWSREDCEWKLRFHQGTPCETPVFE